MSTFEKRSKSYSISTAYILMAVSLVLCFSCATISEKRSVENNTFTSTYPKMAIKVSPELKYVGEYHGDIFKDAFGDDYSRTKVDQVFYIFCQKGDHGNAKKTLAIRVCSVPEGFYWLSDSFGTGSKIDSGKTKVGGMSWEYAVWTTKDLFGPAKNFMQNQGFSTANQHLVGAIGKIISHDRTTKMIVYYTEDLRYCGFPNTMFAVGKKKFVDEFMQRALNALKFMK